LGFQNLPNQYLHIVKYSVDLATLPREGTVDVSTSPIYLQLIENASSFDVGFGSTTYIDNRYTGNTVQQITGMVPFYWSQPESKTNYLFSTELTLSNSAYLTEIAGQKYKITLYDMNNDIIKTNLPNTIPPGVGHVKFFFADPNEIRNSVQMADGTWQYVKLKIEDYVAPSQGTATVTSGTAGGVSAPTPASIPISFTVDQNTILIGFCIVAVLMLALRK
jgi:hypothetical protein